MYEKILSDAGLSQDQAVIYEILLTHGKLPAGQITKKAGLTRPLAYKVLEELVGLELVAKKKGKNNILAFEPQHPSRLESIAEENIRNAKITKDRLGSVLSRLISDFNLVSGKPGIKFFEGDEGIEHIIKDSLSATGEILQYHDPDELGRYIANVNTLYIRERITRKIKKRMLVPKRTSPTYMESYKKRDEKYRTLTEVRFVEVESIASTLTMIYNDKVSYLTLEPKTRIGIVIQSKNIADFHRSLFELNWQGASRLQD